MRIGNVLKSGLLAAALASGCATTDDAKDWVEIKDPSELRALYSNKTIKGHIPWFDMHRPYVLYSKADGTGTIHVDHKQIAMTWALNGNDQVCLKWAGASPCLKYQRHKTRAGVYRSYNPTTKQYGNDMTVTDGLQQKS
jgi:hypothetical protein